MTEEKFNEMMDILAGFLFGFFVALGYIINRKLTIVN